MAFVVHDTVQSSGCAIGLSNEFDNLVQCFYMVQAMMGLANSLGDRCKLKNILVIAL